MGGGGEGCQQDEDWIRSRNSDYQIKHGSDVMRALINF